jgi:hypothetical protein
MNWWWPAFTAGACLVILLAPFAAYILTKLEETYETDG